MFSGEVRVARQGPEAGDDESALQVLWGELALVGLGDARILVVLVLGLVEVPLLLVGEVFDDDEGEGDAGEDQVGEFEDLRIWQLRQDDEVVGWSCDEEEEQGLGEGDEDDVEDEEKEAVVNFGLDDFPAVVLGADFVAAFAPVVECQAELRGSVSMRITDNRMVWKGELTLQITETTAIVSKLNVRTPAIRAQTA